MTGLRTVQDGLSDFQNWASDPRPRIGLGLPFFDKYTNGGLAKSECMMFLAYSSVGKTWLALNMIANNPDMPTMFASLEMSWRQVASRLVAITTGVPTWNLERAIKNGEYPGQFMETMQRFPYLFGNDASDQSIKSIGQSIEAANKRLHDKQIRLVVIDYLELISGNGLLGKVEQVDKAAQKVRSIAKDYDCSVAVLHQAGKGSGTGGFEPLNLDDGKYGGHHPMDAVVGAYAPRLNKKLDQLERRAVREDLYLQLLKNRNGMAEPEGVRHRLSTETGKITPWGEVSSGPSVQRDFFEPSENPYEDLDAHMAKVGF